MNTIMSTFYTEADFALQEYRRIASPKKKDSDVITASCRRAPGIKAAAEALKALVAKADQAALHIPETLRAELAVRVIEASDPALVERMRLWLLQAPHELTRCKGCATMLAVAAPIALLSVQDPKNRNLHLENELLQRVGLRAKRARCTSLGPEEPPRSAPRVI